MSGPIPSRLRVKKLPVLDAQAASSARADIPAAALKAWPKAAARAFSMAVLAASPYLARLGVKRADTLAALARKSPEKRLPEPRAIWRWRPGPAPMRPMR